MSLSLKTSKRWPGRKAGWRDAQRGEAFFVLDFFRTFCIKAKSTEQISTRVSCPYSIISSFSTAKVRVLTNRISDCAKLIAPHPSPLHRRGGSYLFCAKTQLIIYLSCPTACADARGSSGIPLKMKSVYLQQDTGSRAYHSAQTRPV